MFHLSDLVKEEQLVYFPLWTRLHVHWRTLPNFNQFYSTKKPSPDEREEEEEEEDSPDVSSASAPPSKRRRKATKKAAEADRDESVDRQSSPDADVSITNMPIAINMTFSRSLMLLK